MKVLVINSGSSSVKFRLLSMPDEQLLAEGSLERIGMDDAVLRCKAGERKTEETLAIRTHKEGLRRIAATLLSGDLGIIREAGAIDAVGHRVVHGGERFSATTVVDEEVKAGIAECIPLAPLHNPHNLEGIVIAQELFPMASQVAVFDTAFHRSLPLKARKYAIPNHFFEEQRIQAYGFHGISHQYVAGQAISYLGLENSKIITLHLGNGCSMTAVVDGRSREHSLGFAPGNGLIMGSRSGDIDHSLVFYLAETLGYSLAEVRDILTRESGMLGLTGYSDLREIQAGAEAGDADCQLALEMNAYRIRKYIGAYTAAMNGLDALVFTAGIGENSALLRKMACDQLDVLGIQLDSRKNQSASGVVSELQGAASRVKILVIPTNEELAIAREAYRLLRK